METDYHKTDEMKQEADSRCRVLQNEMINQLLKEEGGGGGVRVTADNE